MRGRNVSALESQAIGILLRALAEARDASILQGEVELFARGRHSVEDGWAAEGDLAEHAAVRRRDG